jgi:hypothetical protein
MKHNRGSWNKDIHSKERNLRKKKNKVSSKSRKRNRKWEMKYKDWYHHYKNNSPQIGRLLKYLKFKIKSKGITNKGGYHE